MYYKSIALIIFAIVGSCFCTTYVSAQNAIEYIKNEGQWDAPFSYKARTPSGELFLRQQGFTILQSSISNHEIIDNMHHGRAVKSNQLKFHAYEMNFLNANKVEIIGGKFQKIYYNYFLGNDSNKWKSNIHPALYTDYPNLYNNIDMHVYSENGNIKYDLIVKPGANLEQVKLQYKGVDKIKLQKNNLIISTSLGDNIESIPVAYQQINGERKNIDCRFRLTDNLVSFEIGEDYNPNYELVIDPVIVFCSFTGSTADNFGFTATPGINGDFFAGGFVHADVAGTSYPATLGAFQTTYGGGSGIAGNGYACDASITKFSSNGTTAIYATYIGGNSNDQPHSMIVDKQGNLCIAGRTYSTNFPTSALGWDKTHNGAGDIFVLKLNPAGNALIGSTFIGGSGDDGVNGTANPSVFSGLKHNYSDDSRSEIMTDTNDNVYVASCTNSSNFPMASPGAGAYQATMAGAQDAVIFEFNNNLTNLIWSTHIGGTADDAAYNVTFNKINANEFFVAGGTASSNFPMPAGGGGLNPTYGGATDGFILKFNATSKAYLNGTFIGTSQYDQVYGIQTDHSNNIYAMGQTMGAFPVTAGVYSNAGSRQFGIKLNNNLSANLASTVWGSGATTTTNLALNAFLVDICDNIYISGWGGDLQVNNPGNTFNLPTSANALQASTDGEDFYFIVFDDNFSSLIYASYFGQNGGGGEHVDGGTSRFDEQGVIYQAICANCGNGPNGGGGVIAFPTTTGAHATINPSNNCNVAALKIDFELVGANSVSDALPNATGCAPFLVNFINNSTNATSYLWNFGDGTPTSTATAPTHTYTSSGTFTASLVAYNANGCFGTSDTSFLTINVKTDSFLNNFTITKIDSCDPFIISINNLSTYSTGPMPAGTIYAWDFGDGSPISNSPNPGTHTYAVTGNYQVTLTLSHPDACNSPSVSSQVVNFTNNVISASFTMPDSVCPPYTHNFAPITTNATSYLWNFGDGSPTSNLANPAHAYNTVGIYTVTLIIANPNSCNKFDTASKVFKVLPKIEATFTTVKTDTCDPYIVSITNNSTVNSGNPNATFVWTFGDGTTFTGPNPVQHTYTSDGTYNIQLTITDPLACNSPQVFTVPITFVDNNVRAIFEMPDTVCLPYTHNFVNGSVNVANYAWSFGDGNTSTNAVPSNTYTVPGFYTITLITTNPLTCNKIDTASQTIYASPSPTAGFFYTPNPPAPNKSVAFTNTSVGATYYNWDFGDGQGSTLPNPTHLYNVSGDFIVCLTAFNEANCPDTVCTPITAIVNNLVDVPTGFTPNGDGTNDEILVRGYGILTMDFRIYNRFGELVFQTNDKTKGWDGKYKGVLQEMDAFAYILDVSFTDQSNVVKKGNITLIR